jgi:hypothetical protein
MSSSTLPPLDRLEAETTARGVSASEPRLPIGLSYLLAGVGSLLLWGLIGAALWGLLT